MVIKKSDLYSSLWASCDALKGWGLGLSIPAKGRQAFLAIAPAIQGTGEVPIPDSLFLIVEEIDLFDSPVKVW